MSHHILNRWASACLHHMLDPYSEAYAGFARGRLLFCLPERQEEKFFRPMTFSLDPDVSTFVRVSSPYEALPGAGGIF